MSRKYDGTINYRDACQGCQSRSAVDSTERYRVLIMCRDSIRHVDINREVCDDCGIRVQYTGLHDGLLVLGELHYFEVHLLYDAIFKWHRGCSFNSIFVAWLDYLAFGNFASPTELQRVRNLQGQFNDACYMLIRIMNLWETRSQLCTCESNYVVIDGERRFCPRRMIMDGVELGFSSDQKAAFQCPWSIDGT